MKAQLLILFGLVALLAAGCHGGDKGQRGAGRSDVSMFRGDAARTGVNPGPGVEHFPTILWQFETADPIVVGPVVADGTVYAGSFQQGTVFAVDAATGEERWRFETGAEIYSSPAVVDGIVYVASGRGTFSSDEEDVGHVHALDASTGKELWRFDAKEAINSSPAVIDGAVYVSCRDGYVYALDANTGDVRRRFEAGNPGYSSPAVANGVVYGLGDRYLHALDASTGEERWSKSVGDVEGTPAVMGSRVFLANRQHQVMALDAGTGDFAWWTEANDSGGLSVLGAANETVYVGGMVFIHALEASTGQVRWEFSNGPDSGSALTTVEGIAYGAGGKMGDAGHVHAVDAITGDDVWRLKMGYAVMGEPVLTGGVMYVVGAGDGIDKGYISAIGEGASEDVPRPAVGPGAATPATGGDLGAGNNVTMYRGNAARTGENPGPGVEASPKLLWRFKVDMEFGSIESTPAVVDGVVYFGAGYALRSGGLIYALDATSGDVRWSLETEDGVFSSPAVANGMVYVTGQDGYLYALDAGTGEERWRSNIDSVLTECQGAAGGVVYAVGRGSCYGLDAATGQEQWRHEGAGLGLSCPTVVEGLLYAGNWGWGEMQLDSGYVVALDAANGQERWRFQTEGWVQTAPTVVNGVVYVGTERGFLYAITGE